TRDIGFVIDDILFISKMTNKQRLDEYKALEKYAKEENLHVHKMSKEIEGGDVILHKNLIFIGLSSRTKYDAIKELEEHLKRHKKKYKIIPIKFDSDKMLHLDCVFNVINEDSCIISEYVYNKEILEEFFENHYYINDKTSLELGTNFISLGDNKIISSSKDVCKLLESKGIKTFYIEYSEFIKGGGAFTCTTLPIYVEK
ncbi:MAG: dimethylarginine dimethylaminohydrolase family protein, partial [Sarcina sp.]